MALKHVFSSLAAIPTLVRVKKTLAPRPLSTHDSLVLRMEQVAARIPDKRALIFEGRTLTWREVNAGANRYAHALQNIGIKRGDTVSMIMENRTEFVLVLAALHKLGAVASLINTNLKGKSLLHCMGITGARHCIFGEECLGAIGEVRDQTEQEQRYLYLADSGTQATPDWADDLDALAQGQSEDNPPDTGATTIGETALNIFTSGTTGFPKAAVVSHRRFMISAGMSYEAGLQCREDDCIYLCLPLYHGTGLFLGLGAAFATGACVFIRRKFSGSNFLREAREHNTTCFIYIGELCRYLLNVPEQADDANNPIQRVMGNGLRPDVWHEFKDRFGIERIGEFYGSSEGNVGFVNLLNRDCTIGTTTMPIALVRYDVDADEVIKDSNGRLIEVAPGEPGLLLARITEDTRFEGYTSAEETEKKIMRNAFEDDDAWFNTGDLLRPVDVGFSLGLKHYQFVDRVGDTFRWKSENVSTNEVGEIVNGHPQVDFCNVYGVEIPHTNGRAGMAALVLNEGESALDLEGFSRFVNEQLPAYARPVFLRIQPQLDTTGTFKMVKGDLRKEGYDLAQVSDPLYVMKPRTTHYEALDDAFLKIIQSGGAGF